MMPRGRGGFHAPAFQAKKWVKPGAGDTSVVPPQPAAEAPPAGDEHGLQPPAQHAPVPGTAGPPPQRPAGTGPVGARKWVKGQGVSGPAPPPPPPERGRLSVFVGNLDPLVQEDSLWRFFGQAGRVNRY